MLQEIEQLLVLQDRDRKIRALKQQLNLAPLERKELEARQVSTSASLDAVKLKAKEVEIAKKNLEIEAQTKRDSIVKFKTQQFQTRKNEEFQALSNEIKRYEKDIQEIEDRELDLMEVAEKTKATVVAAEKDFAQLKNQIHQQLADLDLKIKSVESELQRLETERAALATGVDEDLVNRYDRLFASKGDLAIVPLEHEVCMGCHMKITTQTAVRVKGNREIVSCEQCGRILFHPTE
jgi:predicted  nucleic acid-binding Zn-ribbon protein